MACEPRRALAVACRDSMCSRHDTAKAHAGIVRRVRQRAAVTWSKGAFGLGCLR